MSFTGIAALLILAVVVAMFAGPLVLGGWLYWRDRRQRQHAVLRNFPLLGRLRYVWRVANHLITLRAGLASLTAATGLRTPSDLQRAHAVFRDERGRTWTAEELFPTPQPGDPRRPRPGDVPALAP